jgi:hypothetical protein
MMTSRLQKFQQRKAASETSVLYGRAVAPDCYLPRNYFCQLLQLVFVLYEGRLHCELMQWQAAARPQLCYEVGSRPMQHQVILKHSEHQRPMEPHTLHPQVGSVHVQSE